MENEGKIELAMHWEQTIGKTIDKITGISFPDSKQVFPMIQFTDGGYIILGANNAERELLSFLMEKNKARNYIMNTVK